MFSKNVIFSSIFDLLTSLRILNIITLQLFINNIVVGVILLEYKDFYNLLFNHIL